MITPPMKDQCPSVDELQELGDIIRVRRNVLGLSRADASSRAGVSMYVVSRLENGKAVRTDSLVKVFQGLGLAVAARAVNRTRFTLPPLNKAQHDLAGDPVPGSKPSAS